MSEELHYASATQLKKLLLSKEVSSEELTSLYLNRTEQLNPEVNAVVTLLPEKALAAARRADELLAKGETLGVLHGLPVVHKDLANTQGIRTTFGSPIYKDFKPLTNDLIVQRQLDAGAVTLGKTNTPEFGAGSQTFNAVFGATKNPYDTTKTCGGSSGGAAVALASGMTALADGSDMGGSLRNPAAFCNVVGFRPTPGVVPSYPSLDGWSTLSTDGPLARTVADIALYLTALAGADDRVPVSRSEPASRFNKPLERDFKATKIAWCLDFADLPFDTRVTNTLTPLTAVFEDLGCVLETPRLDFSGADEAFKILRAHAFARSHHKTLAKHREQLKDTVIWNIEAGLKLTALDIARAEEQRTRLFVRLSRLMQTYDYLVLPTTQVPAFSVETEYPTDIDGVTAETYIDWMKSCYYISLVGNPAISVPGGFTPEGLPVGLQIVGRYGADIEVLQLAHAVESATRFAGRRPQL